MRPAVLPGTEIVEVVHIAVGAPGVFRKAETRQDIGRGVRIKLPFHQHMAGKRVAAHQCGQAPFAQGGIGTDHLGDELQDQCLATPIFQDKQAGPPPQVKNEVVQHPPLLAVTDVVQTHTANPRHPLHPHVP